MTFANIFILMLIHVIALPILEDERTPDVVEPPEVGTPASSNVGSSRLLRHGS